MKKVARTPLASSRRRMRGAPTREPNSPWLSLPGLVSPSRNGMVSWSESKDNATATRAPPGQFRGASERPARTCCTCPRQVCSSHSHGSSRACTPPESADDSSERSVTPSGILKHRENVASRVCKPGDIRAHVVRPAAHDPFFVHVRYLGVLLELHAALAQFSHRLIDVVDLEVQNGKRGGLMIILWVGKHGP